MATTGRPLSRTEELMEAIRGKIAGRALTAGDRLPSVRRFAKLMGVSPSTVVEAYERLTAEGIVRSRPGSGFYVTGANLPPLALAETEPAVDRAVDPFWVSRQSLDAEPSTAKPGCGWLPTDWLPNGALKRAFREIARADDRAFADYGPTHGSPRLRRLLLGRFAEDGIDLSPAQVMLTASGTQAIDLVCRFLLRPGDTVLVDDPCYFNFRALLRAHQVRIASVPYTPAGPDVAAFEAAAAERPRLYITNSALHNPTGASLSPAVAHRLLGIAGTFGMTIVEDDIFADFEPTPSARLAVLDGLDRVIRIGSFSKTLSASLRCGYVAARADWIEGLVDLQIATSFGGPSPVAAEVIASVLASGSYRKHMEHTRRRLQGARAALADRLAGMGISPWIMPRGGFYLWCTLPEGRDSTAIAKRCLARDVVLAPGDVFSHAQSAGSFMRFNAAQTSDDALRVLGRVLADVSAGDGQGRDASHAPARTASATSTPPTRPAAT